MFEFDARPAAVMGPLGPLTMSDLPSSDTNYWVSWRKTEVLAAIDGGLMSLKEACERYRLSIEEVGSWRRSIAPDFPVCASRSFSVIGTDSRIDLSVPRNPHHARHHSGGASDWSRSRRFAKSACAPASP